MNKQFLNKLAEESFIPDEIIRAGIRKLLKKRLNEIQANDIEHAASLEQNFLEKMVCGPIADVPDLANEQHYEVPAAFFNAVLGKHRKYSCAYFDSPDINLNEAENHALEKTCMHADLQDGQHVLELGCGWGSLTLYMCQRYPNSRFTAVSNSASQGEFIRQQLVTRNIQNVHIVTADMNTFKATNTFDRIVSVEMFEHMRNWRQLLQNVDAWLNPDGRFFMHIFVHKNTPYLYEDKSDTDWMARHFFSGGMMPSAALPLRFQDILCLEQRWFWSGLHYQRTCNAWLSNMDKQKQQLMPLFKETYSDKNADMWWQRWRIFFMACAELFGYKDGQEWFVAHYRLKKASS